MKEQRDIMPIPGSLPADSPLGMFFADFMKHVYPEVKTGSDQWNGLKQAFFAGAMVAHTKLTNSSDRSEAEAYVIIEAQENELLAYKKTVYDVPSN